MRREIVEIIIVWIGRFLIDTFFFFFPFLCCFFSNMSSRSSIDRLVPTAFAQQVLCKAAAIALTRTSTRQKPTGAPLRQTDLCPVDHRSTSLGVKTKIPFYVQGQVIMRENERSLPAGSIVIHAEDIRLAIQLLGVECRASQEAKTDNL